MPRAHAERPMPDREAEAVPAVPETDTVAAEYNKADLLRFQLLRNAIKEQLASEVGEVEVTADMIVEAAGADGLNDDETAKNAGGVKEALSLREEEEAIIKELNEKIASEPAEAAAPDEKPAELISGFDKLDPARHAMLEAVREVARLEAWVAKGRSTPEDRAMLAEARKEYNEKRLEYVGENFTRFADAQRQQIEARREFLEKKKGFAAGAYRVYEKMGQMNLEALGWKPEGKVKKFVAKQVSLKTVVPLALLTTGLALGAGTAVGTGAFLFKRVLAGPMSGMGFYGGLKNYTERKMSRDIKPEKIKEMDLEEAQEQQAKVTGYLLLEGKSPSENRAYQALEAHIVALSEKEKAEQKKGGEWEGQKKMKEALEKSDERFAAAGKKAKRNDNVKKGFGAALGAITGSGALSYVFGGVTRWFGEMFGATKGGAKVAAQSALESHGPTADVSHPAVESQSSSGGTAHPAETSHPRIERPKHVASRGAGSRVVARTPRIVRAPAQTPVAAPKPSVPVESTQSGTKVDGFREETAHAPAPAEAHTPGAEARMRPKTVSASEAQHAAPRPEMSKPGLRQSGVIDGKNVEYEVNNDGEMRLLKINGVDVKTPPAEVPKSAALEPPPAPKPSFKVPLSRPSAPTPQHAPSAEARATPPAEAHGTSVSETQHPKAVEAPRETLRSPDAASPNDWNVPEGAIHFHRDASGVINNVECDFTTTGNAADQVFKDNWMEEVVKHDPSSNLASTRSVLEETARNILNYKTALKDLRISNMKVPEEVKFLESAIKKSSKMLTDRYGDIIK